MHMITLQADSWKILSWHIQKLHGSRILDAMTY